MIKKFFTIVFEFTAGVAGNLIAGYIENDLWSGSFSLNKLLGTIIALTIATLFLLLIDGSGNKKENLSLPTFHKRENKMLANSFSIRDLLNASLDDTDLTNLCYDHFRPVYDKFSQGINRNQKIQFLMEFCEKNGETDKLLNLIKEKNPQQYNIFFAKYQNK